MAFEIIDGACTAPKEARAEMPCCGVLATAVFAGAPFNEVWNRFEALMKRPGKWKGATYDWQRKRVLTDLGVKFDVLKDIAKLNCTVGTFADWYAKPGVMYCIGVRRHVVTLCDGIVTDQTASCHWSEHRNRRSHIISVWQRIDA